MKKDSLKPYVITLIFTAIAIVCCLAIIRVTTNKPEGQAVNVVKPTEIEIPVEETELSETEETEEVEYFSTKPVKEEPKKVKEEINNASDIETIIYDKNHKYPSTFTNSKVEDFLKQDCKEDYYKIFCSLISEYAKQHNITIEDNTETKAAKLLVDGKVLSYHLPVDLGDRYLLVVIKSNTDAKLSVIEKSE